MDKGTPTEDLIKISSLMEEGVTFLLNSLNQTEPIGEYEWQVESRVLLWSAIRHFEALYELMREDTRLIVAANTLSRSCFEMSVRIKWLLAPNDDFARESRYLCFLKEEEDYLRRIIKIAGSNQITKAWEDRVNQIKEFHDKIIALLPRNTKLTHAVPSLRDMLKQLNLESRYIIYLMLSQISHGTHAGGSLYRSNLGIQKVLKEPDQSMWYSIVTIAWGELFEASEKILETTNLNETTIKFPFDDLNSRLQILLANIKGH